MYGWVMYLEIELYDFMRKIGFSLYIEIKIVVMFIV